ncbi:hypothetical protein PENTCL1PPCAC_1981 [Pristionchus entomophagus]|uniref:RNA binding protein n=1 Tax=Pristionchus entomophagus TaxID=358040 RepID=A0AAV5SJI3_9BILA|nr:hypothetical protein PENTCL1PPCAC_1981 [Pristionchus entomophagus]
MAGPPRFTSMPQMGNGFRMNFAPPQPLIGSMMRPPTGPLAPSAGGLGPPKNSQVTTVFVGNISEKADNEFVKQMLEMCGKVVAWKRMAGVSGKLQGFGFCDFEEPEDTLRALRVLNEFQLGDKKLIVKVEQKHRDQLKTFAEKEAGQSAKPNSEELPASEKSLRKDENVRLKILEVIEKDYPDLVKFEDGELEDKDSKKDGKKEVEESKEKKESRRTKRSRSRSGSRSRSPTRRREGRGGRSSPRNKRRRRSSRSSSRSSSNSRSSRSSSRSSSYDSRDRKRRSRRSRSASRATYVAASDDSEDAREKRAIKRQIKEKEMAYAARLREWEGREKKMAKKYEKDESREKNRKLDVNKEAKKLKAFLEDYDDEKDDPKYYKSSSLFARRRDFEREKEADERDRLKEQAEIEELKRQIVEESKAKVKQEEMETREVEEEARRRLEQKEAAARAKHQRDGSGSPNPHQPLGQRRRGNGDGGSSSSESGSDDDEERAEDENDVVKEGQKWSTFGVTDSPAGSGVTSSPAGGALSASPATTAISATRSPLITAAPIRMNTLKQSAASVFGGDEDDDDSSILGRKKLKPFEITAEERIKTMTAGEIKKLQKEIADTIPADKEALFEFEVKRDYLTKGDAMGRVKSWVSKKIREYIGEEDTSLIQFICEKVTSGAPPAKIQDDLAMIIDNEAAAFTIKLWRLVIYETECASRGLPQQAPTTR